MKKSKNRWIDRLMAWVLTFVMIFGLLGNTGMIVNAAQIQPDDALELAAEPVTSEMNDAQARVNLVTVTSNVSTADGVALPNDTMISFTAEGQETKLCKTGESVELVAGATYSVAIKTTGYEVYTATFVPSKENSAFEAVLNVKSVNVTFKVVDKNSQPVTGMTLCINNGNPVQVDSKGEYVYTAKEGTAYAGTVSGGRYGEKKFNGIADQDKTETITLQAKTHTAEIQVRDSLTDYYLQNAEVTLTSVAGTIQAQKSEVPGVYKATVEEGIEYTIQASGAGFSQGSVESVVFDANNTKKEVTVAPLAFSIVSDANQITYPNGTATVQFANGHKLITESGYRYDWVTEGPIAYENGTVKVNGGVGRGTVKAVLKYAEKICMESAPISVTVGNGTIENHSVESVDAQNENVVDKSTATLKFTNLGEEITAKVTVSGGNLKNEVKKEAKVQDGSELEIKFKRDDFTSGNKLQGKIHFVVEFGGENYTYNPSTRELDVEYFLSKDFQAHLNEENLVYGDDREIKIVPVKGTYNEDSTFSYSFVNDKGQTTTTDVMSIDAETGVITILNANRKDQTVNIKVTRNRDRKNYWREASATIENVVVSPKELDPVNQVTYELVKEESYYKHDSKIDAQGEVNVQPETATIDNDAGVLEKADAGKIWVEATLNLPSESADTYTADKDKIIINNYKLVSRSGDVRNYKLPKASGQEIISGTFTVKPVSLTVRIVNKNAEKQNPAVGIVSYQDLDNGKTALPDNLRIEVDGLVSEEDLKSQIEPLKITPVSGLHDVELYENAFRVNLDGKVKKNDRNTENYVFGAEHRWGTLKVVAENIPETALNSVVSYDGTNVYTQKNGNDENNLVWVKGEEGLLKINVESEYRTRYDIVLLAGTSINLTENGILAEELKEKKGKLKVQLAKKREAEGEYKNRSGEFAIPFMLDEEVPAVKFQPELEESVPVADDLLKSLSFGAFDNAVYTANVTISDEGAGFTPVKNQYFVWKLSDTDLTDGVVNGVTVKNKVESISIDQWENFSSDTASVYNETYSVKVAETKTGSADAVEGNYIVLVKAIDNVNNCRVYASNGVVIDVTQPTINVTFEGGKKDYYAGDIQYHIEVTDGENLGVSGVETVEWTVKCNGETVKENSDRAALNKEEENPKYSQDELKKVFHKDVVIESKYCNSNDIQLTVTAKDRAGNKVVSETYNLIIDTTKPDITVTYDNLDVKNGIYFKEGRTATVVFKERNLDKDKATFDLTLEDGRAFKNLTVDRLNEELNAVGVKASWGNEEEKTEKEYTDDRTNTVTVEFSGDNHYSNFVPHCKDKAGNENETVTYPEDKNTAATTKEFVVDKTAPVINGIYYTAASSNIKVGKTENERIYKNQTIDAVITVTEHNFALTDEDKNLKQFAKDQVEYSVKYNKVGENQTIPDYNAQANQTANWISNGDVRTSAAFVYNNDANYTTKFSYMDLAGNQAVWNEEYFTVDKTAPTGTVQVGSRNVVSQFINSITFFLYSRVQIPVSFTGADHTSPILPLVYHKAYTPLNLEQVKAVKTWTQGTGFQVNPNSQVVPYLKVEDRAGNVTYLSSNEIAIADNTAPLNKDTSKPIITVTTGQPPHDIFNQDVSFAIHAEDPVVGDTYSGLATVKYQVLNGNTVTQENTYDYTSNTNRTRVVDKNEVVKAVANNSNHVRIKVIATDNAGNVTEEIKDIKIDITKPEISVTFNNNNGLSGKYYKDTRTATVVVKERNFDPNNVQINVVNTHGTKAEISGWSHGAGESDDATHTATITFASDGDYTFTVDCTDLAMNKAANPYKSEEFTVDKTIPTISVSYDNDNAQNGNYYKASRTATITINEHNFNAGDVKVTTTASNGRTPGVSGWSGSGDRHTATVEFDSDADYTFDISYIDMAGNSAAEYDQDRFTVDLTKPSMEITGVANKSANKGTVAPVITVSDTNYIASGVTISLTGANRGKVDTSSMVSRTNSENGQIITFRNFGSNMDDIYTLVAKSVDKAGNETTQSITFSVNRDGSAYNINQSTKDLIEKGFTNNPQDIVIEEVNVDTLEFIEISYSKDGKIVKLTEGKDYKVEAEGGEGQWKKYTYTIFAKCFNEEGEYSINISSTDRAENISNNKVQSVNVDFVVDMTAPIMAVSNLENRGRYKENRHEYTLNVKDNTMLTMVQIYLDDKLFKTYEVVDGKLVNIEDPSDVLEIENGKVYLGIDSKNMYQKIKLVSTDAAGNVSETEDYNVLVTSSNLVQFYMNKPLFYGSIFAVIAACGIIIFLILKKKRA